MEEEEGDRKQRKRREFSLFSRREKEGKKRIHIPRKGGRKGRTGERRKGHRFCLLRKGERAIFLSCRRRGGEGRFRKRGEDLPGAGQRKGKRGEEKKEHFGSACLPDKSEGGEKNVKGGRGKRSVILSTLRKGGGKEKRGKSSNKSRG